MTYLMRLLFLIFLKLLFAIALTAQKIITPGVIQDSIFRQLELFPQEKIHLHTDRDLYVSGEKIWLTQHFFKKPIRINNLMKVESKTLKQSDNAYDVSFFPEGGYLTEGVILLLLN